MADVFSNTPPEDDEEATPGIRVAGALTGDGEETASEEEPQAEQPRGMVDGSAQSYLVPAAADDGGSGESAPHSSVTDVPVSADTKAYMTPIAPPTLGKPAAFADHSADTAAMTAQRQAESQQNLKPSVGRRILAGLAGGAVAFGGGDGSGTVEKVLNRPADNAHRLWAQQEAPLQAKLNADAAQDAATVRANASTEAQNKVAETNYGNQIRGQMDTARADTYKAQAEARRNAITAFTPDDPANPYAGGTGTTADGRKIPGVPPPDKWILSWEKAHPELVAQAQAKKGIATLKAMQAAGLKLTPEQQAIVGSGGHVTPAAHTNISILENPDGSARTPAGAGPNDPSTLIAKSMQDKDTFVNQWKRVGKDEATEFTPEGSYVNIDDPGKIMNAQEFNARIDKFRTDLNANTWMRKSGTMVDPQGNTVTNRFSRTPQQQAAPQQAQPSPAAQPQQPAAKPPRTPAKGLPDNTAARNPRTGKVEWIVKGGTWTPAQP